MRKLILHMMTTVDGFIADSQGNLGGWTNWDEEMRAFYNDEVFAATDTIMYGRGIYEEMVPAWTAIADLDPLQDKSLTEGDVTFGKRVRAMKKVVVSTTLEHVGPNAILIRDNIAERIIELKMMEGADILLYCGPRLVATLTELGLIDEYMLYVNPILLGQGTRLFGDLHGHDVHSPLPRFRRVPRRPWGEGCRGEGIHRHKVARRWYADKKTLY